MIAGHVLDRDFVRFRKSLTAKWASHGVPYVAWNPMLDPCFGCNPDDPHAMIQYGRINGGEKVEVVLIMRDVEVDVAFRLARRDATQAIFIMAASEDLMKEHGGNAGSNGYVLLHGNVPSLGQFRTVALICRRNFDVDALIGEAFPPAQIAAAGESIAFVETPPSAAIGITPSYG